MPANVQHARSRTRSASWVVLLFAQVVLLVTFQAGAAFAAEAAFAAAVGAASEPERPLCDSADLSAAPGSCQASPDEARDLPARDELAAPMCDLSAASVAAVIEIPEVDRGRIEPLPCDTQRLLSLLRSHAHEVHGERGLNSSARAQAQPRAPMPAKSPLDRHDGDWAFPMQLDWPERGAAIALTPTWPRGLAWQPGHLTRVYRPPSAQA